jgi:hypothetical protein
MKQTTLTHGSGSARRTNLVAALAVGLFLAFGGGGSAAAAPAPILNPFVSTCSNAYFDGDVRLGPAQLANFGSFAPILIGYNRLAGLTPAAFIATYWDPAANAGSGGWRFPPDNGFLLDSRGNPIEFVGTLAPGAAIDRFGSEFGAFLAPQYTPYAQRALPPMSLDNFDANYTCNYHVYRVLKTFHAEEGPIAPGFGQLGRGIQFQLVSSLVPGAPSPLNVMWLINNGYLARAN